MDNNVFRDISYGLYIVSTDYAGRKVGCVINTLSQVTSQNPIISFSLNKQNYTNEAIKNTKRFAVSIVSENINNDIIYTFGYNTSKDMDKFKDYQQDDYEGIPVVTDGMCSYIVCELIQAIDCETHDIFIARVIDTKKISNAKEMTYRYYHEVVKGTAPKNAPTYIEDKVNNEGKTDLGSNENGFAKYRCLICGYIYDEAIEKVKFTDLPEAWKCPRCGVGKENFVKI